MQNLSNIFTFLFGARLKQGIDEKSYVRIPWSYWFKKVLYYQVALVYVFTRLITNVSQVCIHFLYFVCTVFV